jgi:hypothetical protein
MPCRHRRPPGRRSHLPIALVVALLPVAALAADLPPRPPVEAARTTATIFIDGVLDEEAWASATIIDDFLQQLPLDAAPPSERTVVRILYDDDTLYLGFRCYDRDPSKIQIGTLLRDSFQNAGGEAVTWAIDSTDSGRDGYWFSSNPGGAQADSQVVNEGEVFRPEWDGVWDAAGRIDADAQSRIVRPAHGAFHVGQAGVPARAAVGAQTNATAGQRYVIDHHQHRQHRIKFVEPHHFANGQP